ncbi:GTPase-activating protein and VPS9 domain-containing protein 1-like isoform X2 [Bolinopsis microptera]|uniref:GTPase-activating protein and VPS9 domain-containing protein 1-like isoform X2 n=1 Tax=Bolinopsis microptera TaxID=2820187 RepID=UPI003078C6EF
MERIRSIQQNLWQTKLFINHEKEAITKLQDDIKGPTNKVNKSAWVINHKWRSLRTKKANPKELCDVDKYSQSLDKSRFYDARDKIGAESEKYAAFLKYLRDKSSLVAVIFLTEGTKRRQPEELSELIHSLFSALFGFAILPDDEKRIVRVIGDIAKILIAEYQGAISSFFHHQTALSLSFRLYIEWSSNTRVYMGELMSDIVMNVMAEPEFLIVDETKYLERHPNAINSRAKVDYYRKRIATHVISMITQIRRHLHSFPPYLRWLGVSIVQYFQIYRGATQDDINIFLGELFFTRMLFYPFLQPQIYLSSKIESTQVSDLGRHNLLQVTYTFREAFLTELGVPSSSARQKYSSVLPFIGNHSSEMVLLLEELVDVPYSSTVIPTIDIPVQRSAVLITERDLRYIINLLMEVLASGKFQPEEKEMLATALSLLPVEPCSRLSAKKPGRKISQASQGDKNTKRNRPTLPDNFTFEEEVLVFPLPGVATDKVKTEAEVLGKNIDREEERLFDERKMSVLLTSDHPLTADSEQTAQEDIKGRLLQDFDLLFHNPSMQLQDQESFTPDGVSLSSANSYDSLDRQPECGSVDNVHLSTLTEQSNTEGDSATLQPGESLYGEESTGEEVRTPVVEQNAFNLDNFETSTSDSAIGSVDNRSTILRVNMNNKTGGFFYEPSPSLTDSGIHEGSLLRNSSHCSLSRLSGTNLQGLSISEHELPIDIISSEYVYQNQNVQPAMSEDQILQNAINKLKIAFSLFPHFYKSYYPKIGVSAPATTIDLISLSPSSGVSALVVDDDVTSEHKQLLEYLHSEYSDAGVHNSKNSVQIEQAIIALKQIPPRLLPTVLSKLEEYNTEQSDYIHYLIERKCELMRAKEFLARVQAAVEIKHDLFFQTLSTLVISSFLKTFDDQIKEYRRRFKELVMADEKAEVYDEFIDFVSEKMNDDFAIQTLAINHAGCDERECVSNDCTAMENHRTEVLRQAEIGFFNAVFSSAFLPNGEAQRQKDNVFRESLGELRSAATLDHPDIQIPAKYHNEAPWLPAQRHLALLPAHKSPSGKLTCIMNCVFTIFKLLFVGASGLTILEGRTDDSAVPGADDLLPVLIYVIIHANPPNLLSTIDYIDNFTPRGITGQDQYMLMQFRGATEFIKSMLHKNPRVVR